MRFSIVIPSYNQGEFLEACIQSVVEQEVELEILLLDGGSTDDSPAIIERYQDRFAYCRSEKDDGQAAAIAEGFSRATGDILGWLNSDDILLPGALRQVDTHFSQHADTALLYGDAVWIDRAGAPLHPRREHDFDWKIFAHGYCYLLQPSAFFSRAAYERAGGVDPSFVCCMDYDLWHRLYKEGPVRHLPAFLSGVREHGETKTSRLKDQFATEDAKIRERYAPCPGFLYPFVHAWQRLRRIMLRRRIDAYRPLSPAEREACGFHVTP